MLSSITQGFIFDVADLDHCLAGALAMGNTPVLQPR